MNHVAAPAAPGSLGQLTGPRSGSGRNTGPTRNSANTTAAESTQGQRDNDVSGVTNRRTPESVERNLADRIHAGISATAPVRAAAASPKRSRIASDKPK